MNFTKPLAIFTNASPLPNFLLDIRHLPTAPFDHPPSTKVSWEWSTSACKSHIERILGSGEV